MPDFLGRRRQRNGLCQSVPPHRFRYTLIGAFFLAPDWSSSPYTRLGALLFGVGAGVLTMIIRYWGAYLDGVFFAILFLNALTPILDRLPKKSYGRVKAS